MSRDTSGLFFLNSGIRLLPHECPRCQAVKALLEHEVVSGYIDIQKALSRVPAECSHEGMDALFIALLLKKPALFSCLYHTRRIQEHGGFRSHSFLPRPTPFLSSLFSSLWPTPFFRHLSDLQAYVSWGMKEWNGVPHMKVLNDKEFLNLASPLHWHRCKDKFHVSWISKEKGFGLLSRKNIPSNTFLGLYSGLVRRIVKGEKKDSRYTAFVPSPKWHFFKSDLWAVDSLESGSVSRFINHSREPNSGASILLWRGMPMIGIYSIHAVKKGEEIVINYGSKYWRNRKI